MPLSTLTTLMLSDAVEKGARYLVTEDDGTTHLPYTDESGKIDHGRMGGAWAALHGGYRGSKYEGPNKAKAIARLKSIYESEGMEPPAEKCGVMKGGPGSGARPGMAPAGPATELESRIASIKARKDSMKVRRVARPARPSAFAVSKAAATQARHVDTGKWVPGKEAEATSQAHSATLAARVATEQSLVRGGGDQKERHEKASKIHTKAKAAHERAAAACDGAACPAMAQYHREVADKHGENAATHSELAELFSQVG